MGARRTEPLGRLSRRELPERDETIASLPRRERTLLARVWTARIDSEHRAVEGFEYLAATLAELGAPPTVTALARRAIDDERRHEDLCRLVAAAYAGAPVETPPAAPFAVLAYEDASPELRATLHIVSQCCLTETIGSSFLESCLRHTTAPLARAALHELLADEVDHARIGWAQLARATPEVRRGVSAQLPDLVRRHLEFWRPRVAFGTTETLLAHGFPSSAALDEVVFGALSDVILPGMRQAGIDTDGVSLP